MKKTLNINQKLIDLSVPKVMGILNVTPDSFYSDSRVPQIDTALRRAEAMLAAGATFLDVGGYSTRPNATDIPESEELERVLPVIELIIKHFPDAIVSIDAFRATVARQAVEAGAAVVNDISGGNLDPNMFETVAALGVPYVLMHSRGNPQTMALLNNYGNLTVDVIFELQQKIAQLRALGVKDIIIDPGFGFAKNATQNFELFKNLEAFQILDCPLLVGNSRKSMIWRTLDIRPEAALNATTALNALALNKGAQILRVHDIKEAIEVVKLWSVLND
jgi:dihydropteroate synthase